MMPATAIDQTYAKLSARDVERTRAFYADKLGLTPFGEHDGHLFYEVGGTHFMVYPSGGVASGTHDRLGFVVEDVGSTVAALRSRGVLFEEYEPPRERPRATRSWTLGASSLPGSGTARATY
jgi:catechol 2,3-dioxygenase-like lactoylglutathione lyase family enzyme